MAKPTPPNAERATRTTWRVLKAFAHEGIYYVGSDVPEIGKLPAKVREDRIQRGYVREYKSHAPAQPEPAPTHVTE